MKKCPYCAEDIQDAAIVCKHCGRELRGANAGTVTVRAKSRGWLRVLALLVGVVIVGTVGMAFMGGLFFALKPTLRNQHVSGECRLSGASAVTPYDAPVAGGVLALTNRDSASWANAELRIYGTITSGPDKGRPTGVHKLRRDVTEGLNAIKLGDFENDDGSRWVPVMMHVEGLGITAMLNGERCELETSFR